VSGLARRVPRLRGRLLMQDLLCHAAETVGGAFTTPKANGPDTHASASTHERPNCHRGGKHSQTAARDMKATDM
jgi:hypothetical protein